MPNTVIEVRRRYTQDEEVAIIDTVHDALVAAFEIPPENKYLRLVAHEPHRFSCAPKLARPERYTQITIECFAGRSVQAKRNLYGEIVNRLGVLDIPADHVSIVVRENTAENFGIRGGQAACDVDLGYPVNV